MSDETDIPITLAEAEPAAPVPRKTRKAKTKTPGVIIVTRDQWEKDFAAFYEAVHGALGAITADDRARVTKADARYVAEPYGAIAERYDLLKHSGVFVFGTAISRTAEVEGRTSYPVIKDKGLAGILFGPRRKPSRRTSSEEPDPIANGHRPAPADFRGIPTSEEWAAMSEEERQRYSEALS